MLFFDGILVENLLEIHPWVFSAPPTVQWRLGASPRTADLAVWVPATPHPHHPPCSQIWILPPTASRHLKLVLSTATTPAFCLSSPLLRLALMVDAEIMLIFPLLFHKWSKSNKENESTKHHFWQIWEMVGRWKRCQKKWDQVGVHGERRGDVPCMLSRTLLGKAGALLGHHTQVP